jgi:hypothetical protein
MIACTIGWITNDITIIANTDPITGLIEFRLFGSIIAGDDYPTAYLC